MSISSMRVTILPRRYDNHITLATSICDPSKCFEEVGRDSLMEECDVCRTMLILGLHQV